METINNVAAAAAKAVWGDSDANKEPVSGAKGDVGKGEPYDAGNLDPDEQRKVETKPSSDNNVANDISSKATTAAAPVSAAPMSAGNQTATPTAGDTTKFQSDTRHPDDVPNPAEEGPTDSGPKPLNVVGREHGGDAGQDHKPAPAATAVADDVADSSSPKDKGTGEEYVKSTGVAAEGGDFDATKPGAGKEADRLLEQQRIHRADHTGPPGDKTDETTKDSKSSHSKNKPSLGDRIKAKFHKK